MGRGEGTTNTGPRAKIRKKQQRGGGSARREGGLGGGGGRGGKKKKKQGGGYITGGGLKEALRQSQTKGRNEVTKTSKGTGN